MGRAPGGGGSTQAFLGPGLHAILTQNLAGLPAKKKPKIYPLPYKSLKNFTGAFDPRTHPPTQAPPWWLTFRLKRSLQLILDRLGALKYFEVLDDLGVPLYYGAIIRLEFNMIIMVPFHILSKFFF